MMKCFNMCCHWQKQYSHICVFSCGGYNRQVWSGFVKGYILSFSIVDKLMALWQTLSYAVISVIYNKQGQKYVWKATQSMWYIGNTIAL